MFLHEDRELFEEAIVGTGEQFGLTREVVEKDYYVTMILKQLAERSDLCVFKGGTSLSKCFHAIDRFSEDIDIAEEYHLQPFEMRVQSLNRTFIDKIFALCDYYMQGKSKRYSRHLYDLFKLRNRICFDDEMKDLVREVREHRKGMSICPSAQESVDIVALVNEFCDNDFYKSDYESITEYFVTESVEYNRAIANILEKYYLLF